MTDKENGETGDSGTDRTRSESFVVVDSSTSSDFEGGSSGGGSGAVPTNPSITTPSTLPRGEAEHLKRKSLPVPPKRQNSETQVQPDFHGSDVGTLIEHPDPDLVEVETQTAEPFITFSAQTCRELLDSNLLSPTQLEREYNYMVFRGLKLTSIPEREGKSIGSKSVYEIKQLLGKQVSTDFSETLNALQQVTNSVSYMTEKVEAAVDFFDALEPESPAPPPADEVVPEAADETAFFSQASLDSTTRTEDSSTNSSRGTELPESVCSFLNIDFSDLSVDDICANINFEETAGKGGRQTAYFGSRPYSYGKISHNPAAYPTIPAFESIFRKMQEKVGSDFTPDNYTCLVTYYANGMVGIPAHSDDEKQIEPHSDIITISVGAPRTMRFVNKIGKVTESDVSLPHGSVFSMQASSQMGWSHCLIADRTITAPRVSFTFRRLRDSVTQNSTIPQQVPPIKPPTPVKPTIACGTHRRILFLTDSVLKNTPEFIFNNIGGNDNYRCIKKVNYQLADVLNFEPEFRYSDIVIISCGVNDLARYGKRPEVLADLVIRRLKECCEKHKHTSFIFTSILSTNHQWLNNAIGRFNKFMSDLANEVSNMSFFDSHHVLLNSSFSTPWSRVPVIRSDGDGIHITFEARKLITNQLVNGLEVIVADRECRTVPVRLQGWTWPVRFNFRHRLRTDGLR